MHKIDILIPCHNEPVEVIKPLLDSIALQRSINFNDVGVIICCDGGETRITDEFLKQYPYHAEFHLEPHRGVSGTRNACFDYSTAEYVMWCDADDIFFNVCGLYIIFREIDNGGFDHLVSAFVEETRNPLTKEPLYINHDMDSTFVHGKVSRRQYLIDENIRWNEALTIHEDSYGNCLMQKLAKPDRVKYCPQPFYLWCWRDESVCRHDPKYILKTYPNMLDSNTALVKQFVKRNRVEDACFYATAMIYDAYLSLNCDEWCNINNKEYRDITERRFKQYWTDFKLLFEKVPKEMKIQILAGIRQRFFQQGLLTENITFDDFVKHIEEM